MSDTAPQGTNGYWTNAPTLWQHVESPLRPAGEDLAFFAATINGWAKRHGPPRALLLGVTPELYDFPWPHGTDLLAVDRSQAMIDKLWTGPRDAVYRCDWRSMDLGDDSRDIVICDGGLSMLEFPHGIEILASKLRRIVCMNGLCVFRLYVPGPSSESVEAVFDDLRKGKIRNQSLLKIRLWLALQDRPQDGVTLKVVWETFRRCVPDPLRLAAQIGWTPDHMLAINGYRDCDDRYFFPTTDAIRNLFCHDPGGFTFHSLNTPAYDLGDLCPTIVLRR